MVVHKHRKLSRAGACSVGLFRLHRDQWIAECSKRQHLRFPPLVSIAKTSAKMSSMTTMCDATRMCQARGLSHERQKKPRRAKVTRAKQTDARVQALENASCSGSELGCSYRRSPDNGRCKQWLQEKSPESDGLVTTKWPM